MPRSVGTSRIRIHDGEPCPWIGGCGQHVQRCLDHVRVMLRLDEAQHVLDLCVRGRAKITQPLDLGCVLRLRHRLSPHEWLAHAERLDKSLHALDVVWRSDGALKPGSAGIPPAAGQSSVIVRSWPSGVACAPLATSCTISTRSTGSRDRDNASPLLRCAASAISSSRCCICVALAWMRPNCLSSWSAARVPSRCSLCCSNSVV